MSLIGNNPQDSPAEGASFEEALMKLEAIVHQLEDGEIGLADALARYEAGVGLLRQCYRLLERAERTIEILSGVDADGNPVTEPFDDRASFSATEAPQPTHRRRAGAPAKREPPC